MERKRPDWVAQQYFLSQNYPNRFNPATSIQHQISSTDFVTLKVFDVVGREVSVLVNERKEPGIYSVQFDATGLASGVYFYKMIAGSFVQTRKMLLLQ